MKKLKLKALDLGANEVLTREQLKKVMGGDTGSSGSGGPGGSGGSGSQPCKSRWDCNSGYTCFSNTCQSAPAGTVCTNDDNCGRDYYCVARPYPFSGTWCA